MSIHKAAEVGDVEKVKSLLGGARGKGPEDIQESRERNCLDEAALKFRMKPRTNP